MVTRNRVKWTMLWTYLINFVLVLVLAGNASATRRWDAGGAADRLWSTPANWSGNVVPTNADDANINNPPDANCLIDSTVDACCTALDVGYNTGPCYLNMTGGTLTTSLAITVGNNPSPGEADTNGVFKMSGGDVNIGGSGRLWIGYGSDTVGAKSAYGTLIMTGGVINIPVAGNKKLELGKNLTGVGRMYMQGGTINIGDDFELGKKGNATFVMTGGDVNVTDTVKLGAEQNAEWDGTSHIDLHGGLITCDDLFIGESGSTMDVTEGAMFIESDDALVKIQGYAANKQIKAYGGSGTVNVYLQNGGVNVDARPGDPNLAWSPSPGNYAIVEWTPPGPALSWKPGRYEDKHDVYFGTDEDDVNDANNTSPEFEVRQDPCTFAFPSPPPELGQTYYWRIDEVNDACAPKIWKGDVWQFTMADYEEVEDFDSYANDAALEAVWKLSGDYSDISIEKTIVHSRANSMKYVYYNGDTTEADANANTTGANKLPVDINDWTTADIKALTLYFSGDVGNSNAEKMYVALKSIDNKSAVVYYDDSNDLKEPEWHEWNIKLSDFTDVNLRSIAKVYIGFGNRGSPPTNDGTVYFDDIRLYPTRCVASFAPEGDIDGDCIVDFVDVNIMAGDWLETDYNGVGRDGVLKGGASWVAGYYGNGVQLDGTNDWVDLNDSDFSNFHNKTIAFWVKVMAYPSVPRYIFYFSDGDEDNPYRIYILTRTADVVRARFLEDYSIDFLAYNNWCHLVFVLEDTDDGRCTGTFYGNAILVDNWTPGQPRHSGSATGVNLGSADDGSGDFVNAVYDDFRVYNRALSPTEVENLYAGGEPGGNMLLHYNFNENSGLIADNSSTYEFYHPLLSDAELYEGEAKDSRVVNLKDFAILADSWLKEQLWP